MNINEAALRHLANRSRTEGEMIKHLKSKGFDDEEIKETVEELKTFRYIDDSRYCEEYFRYAFGKGKGKRKVFAELREKGVNSQAIEIAFEDYEAEEGTDERARAMEEAEKVLRLADIDREAGDEISEKFLPALAESCSQRVMTAA